MNTASTPTSHSAGAPAAGERERERHVSLLTRASLAMVLAGGRTNLLGPLTDWRAKAAVPFGGKFRVVDFALSNCMHSGIRRVCLLTQYNGHSLIKHIQTGWSFLRGEFNEFVEVLPPQQRAGETAWYAGTADAIYQNLHVIRAHRPKYVVVLSGDHVYKMDYGPMVAAHVAKNAQITVGCIEVPLARARSFGILQMDQDNRVTGFAEKPLHPEPLPGRPDTALASMGIYVFSADYLVTELQRDAAAEESSHELGRDLIPAAVGRVPVYAYPFRDVQKGQLGYWRDLNSVDAYWDTHMELLAVTPPLNLYDRDWPIWTFQDQLPPAKFVFDDPDRRGTALNSMVAGGCIVGGAHIRRSLLFTNVRVESHSELDDSVILPDVSIGARCRIRRAVIDKGCSLADGTVIGYDREDDARRFHVTPGGVTLVTTDMLGQSWHTID